MRLVVSDAGPLHYLILCEVVNVLPILFREVVIPKAVADELTARKAPTVVVDWIKNHPGWLRVVTPKMTRALPSLDRGECDAIALSQELGAKVILMDDRVGRRVAREQGLLVLGTLGVIEQAAAAGHIQLRPVLERLATTNIRLSQNLIAEVLKRDKARKG